jgi:hypothetical protein
VLLILSFSVPSKHGVFAGKFKNNNGKKAERLKLKAEW